MFKRLLIGCMLVTGTALAQDPQQDPSRPDLNTLSRQGQLLNVRLSLGQPIKIFIVGKEEARIDLNELNVQIRRLNPYPAQDLVLSREGDYFVLGDQIAPDQDTRIEVRAGLKGKSVEKFLFKLDGKRK
ncbi:MAG: hypothetical protein AB7N80_04310 [Bdellovibrionales bacterium]